MPLVGHAREFLRDPVALLQRGHREHGEVFALRLPGGPAVVTRIAADAFLGEDFARRLGDDLFTAFRRFSAGTDVLAPPLLPLPHPIRSRQARDPVPA